MEQQETQQQSESRPWLWKKGQSGNPGGRKKGSKSMKQWVKEKLESMTPEERDDFLEGIDKKVVWAMAEGNPKSEIDQKDDITIKNSDKILRLAEGIKRARRGGGKGVIP